MLHVGRQFDGIFRGQHPPPIEEFTLQQTANQSGFPNLEHQMLAAQGEPGFLVGVAQDFFHFFQRGAGGYKGHDTAGSLLKMEPAQGQTIAVHGHHSHIGFRDLKAAAGVDRAGLIFRNRKNGAGDQLLQRPLGDRNAVGVFHIGQLRIVFGVSSRNGKGGNAAADGHLVVVVHRDGDLLIGELPHNIKKQAGRKNTSTSLHNLCRYRNGNTGFQIITSEL